MKNGLSRLCHHRRKIARAVLWFGLAFSLISPPLQAGAVRANLGFTNGGSLSANDDQSSSAVPLGFTINYYGTNFANVFVNNNGNATFDQGYGTYTPYGITNVVAYIMAPFFADVDTRATNSQVVTWGNDTVNGRPAFGVNWVNVGYYSYGGDKLNSFQLVLINRSDISPGDFDIEFNYDQILWETGSASSSGGVNGFGGKSAAVGFSNGSLLPGTSYQMPGSMVPGSFLDSNLSTGLIHGQQNSGGVPGRYVWNVRSGHAALTIQAIPLAIGTVGVGYSNQTLQANNGTLPYTWTVVSNSPPTGLSLSSAGIISGTPTLGATTTTFQVQVRDSLGATAQQNFTLTIAAGSTTRQIGVSGNLAFGNVVTGATLTATLTITNSGPASLTVSNISYPSNFSGPWSGLIATGSSHAVTVTFAPTAITTYGGTITVNSDATGGTNTIAASGTGSAPVPLAPITAHYGPPAAANTWTMYSLPLTAATFGVTDAQLDQILANVKMLRISFEMSDAKDVGGIDTVSIGSVYSSAFGTGTEGWGSGGDGTMSWQPTGGQSGGYLQIADLGLGDYHYAVAPVAWMGNWTALKGQNLQFWVKTTNPDYAGFVEITGGGATVVNRLLLAADTYAPAPGQSFPLTVSLNATATVATVVSLSSSAAGVVSVPATVTIPAGALQVQTTAQAAVGALNGQNATITAALTGYASANITLTINSGATKIIGLSGSLAFGNVVTGTTLSATLVIRNSGTTNLTVSSLSYPSGFSGPWSGTIAAGGTRNVTVTFAPLAIASYGGTVTVSSDATSGTNTITAAGAGVAAGLPGNSARTNPGFGNGGSLAANDDASSAAIPIGFTINFYGTNFANVFVNNNGNVTFDQGYGTYTPYGLTNVVAYIMAPFFADVDTRATNSQVVTWGSDTINGRPAFGVNWINVGYYPSQGDKLNSFQLILINRSDIAPGDFDMEFNYNRILWETGGASSSGGVNGFGGKSAAVGFSNGSLLPGTSYQMPGSMVPGSFLDSNPTTGLIYGQQNSGGVPGRYVWRVRSGQIGLIIQALPLAAGAVGTSYPAQSLQASGGTLPYSWSIVSGSLPAGLGLVASSGSITGTPTVVTTANFRVRVTDAASQTAEQDFSLTVNAGATKTIGLTGNLAFGSVLTGTTATATLTITNRGTASLTVSNLSYPSGFSGAWNGLIATGGAHTVTVTFAPIAATNYGGTVTINSDATGGSNTVSASGTGVLASALTVVINTNTLIATGNTTYDGQNIVVSNCTLTANGPHSFNSLRVIANGVVTHTAATNAPAVLQLTVTGNLLVDATAKIDVTGRGYPGGYSVGNVTNSAATGLAGGSYGGLGVAGTTGQSNPTYGDYHDPANLGSGSGSSSPSPGGGLIRITAGSAQIDGAILANGASATGCGALAGGSGGGLLLNVGTLSGSGRLAANGGDSTYCSGSSGGSGGGGRVAVYYTTLSGFDLLNKVTAHAGAGNGASPGSVGTVYLKPGSGAGQLLLANHGTAVGLWTPLGNRTDTVFQAESLVIAGTNVIAATVGGAPMQVASLAVVTGAVLTHPATTSNQVFALQLTVNGNLLVDATAKIDVTGRGYPGGFTVGNGTNSAATGLAGGSYGGLGVAGTTGQSNPTYGDYHDPANLGSGSGSSSPSPGGGLIRITAGSAQIDGAILANGASATGCGALGGGSGGGLLLNVGALSGSGRLAANGGDSTYCSGSSGGSGGGGRVAVYYTTLSGFDLLNKVTAHAGAGNGASPGSVGTVYLKPGSGAGQLLLANHGTAAGLWTPLGNRTDTVFQVETLVIAGANLVAAPAGGAPIQAANLSVINGAVLTHPATTSNQVSTLQVIVTGNLLVDATGKIDVTGRGYPAGYTVGNTINGAATGLAGGSYGGLGVAGTTGQSNPTYGDYHDPSYPGSGSGNGSSSAGGGLVRIIAANAQIDGAILANGAAATGCGALAGGSGGGLLLNVGTLSGNGPLTANGGNSTYCSGWSGGNGGGGRVAIYTWNAMSRSNTNNVTANGGTGSGGAGQTGTVTIATSPYFTWENSTAILHGAANVAWAALGIDPTLATVAVTAALDGNTDPLTSGANLLGSVLWQTTTVPDGRYELRAICRNSSGTVLGDIAQTVLVNNSVAWHGGLLATNQTWAAGTVHVVDQSILIASNVTVTIQAGAIVKFVKGVGITVLSGGILNAPATTLAPIVLTALADDTAGGDTNLDGEDSVPEPGDWSGITVQGTGQFNAAGAVDIRYSALYHTGTLTGNETWSGSFLHIVTGELIVPGGKTLTIQPGAVVKFGSAAGITIQDGGTLSAQGLVALPITFTSLKDDTVAGDTNGDGGMAQPAAGDWRSIRLSGSAVVTLRHAVLRYGGNSIINTWGAGGMIENDGGNSAPLTVDSCIIDQSLKDGILGGGSVNISNSVISANDRGVTARVGTANLINCTVYNNRQGLLEHVGTLTVRNCIVVSNLEVGVVNDLGSDVITVSYSDVWNPGAANYNGTSDKTGQNGNISVNPQLKNPATGNFRLGYRSPCIDAADGTVAPATDFMGAPRFSDPRTTNKTGVVMVNGQYADMGAFEFVENAPSDLDLIGTTVTGPTTATAGSQATVRWTVANIGTGRVVGPWHDTISLAAMTAGSGDPLWAGEVLVGRGVVLGPGQTYNASATVRVPGGTEGQYQWLISVNSQGEVFEGINATNNNAWAATPTSLTVLTLTMGGPLFTNQFTNLDQFYWFKLVPPSNTDFQVSLQLASGNGAVGLYLAQGYMPTLQLFDWQQTEWNSPTATVVVPDAAIQPYYVLATPEAFSNAPAAFTISAAALGFRLTSVTPATIGAAGNVTLKLQGGALAANLSYQIIDAAGTPHTATALQVVNSAVAYATFNLTDAALGNGMVRVIANGTPLSQTLQIVAPAPGQVEVHLTGPAAVRPYRDNTLRVEYRNTGNTDVTAPLLLVTASSATLRFPDQRDPAGHSLWVLGINPEGPAGILPAGGQGAVELVFNPDVADQCNFNVQIPPSPTNAVDWASVKNSLRPDDVPTAAWEVIYSNYLARVGATLGQYQSILAADATALSELGQSVANVRALTAFELDYAGASGAISQRYRLGAFGYGQMDPTDVAAVPTANGNVRIRMSQAFVRYFIHQTDGSFAATAGDRGTLTRVGDHYQLAEIDGATLVFRSDNRLDYVEDAKHNRVTFGYTGSQLTSWTDSTGDNAQLTYNAQGRVSRLTDPVGRVTTFAYDAAGEHLIQMIAPDGTTNSYTYLTGQGAAREHALAAVAAPNGTQRYFTYDARGALTRVSREDGTTVVTATSDSPGATILTDANGSSTKLVADHLGRVRQFVGPSGNLTRLDYNAQNNLTSLTLPGGLRSAVSYDPQGNPIAGVDALGQRTTAEYDPVLNVPLRLRNPAGAELQFNYDPQGNPLSLTYPDQRAEQVTYDANGRVTTIVNARGHAITCTYTSTGLLARKQFADGSRIDFAYDAHRNLTNVTQIRGATTQITTLAYDAADRLTGVTDPFHRTVAFTYDHTGRRTRLATSDGFIVNYGYDTNGRLALLTDGTGQPTVTYTYDGSDRVLTKQLGNGTVTTYEYDAAGRVIHLVNKAPNTAILSRFDYAYDELGRRTQQVTLQGTTAYAYDAAGQLSRVTLPGGRVIRYTYDANGNRQTVTDNGTATTYLANSLDQYLTVGSATAQYDANGNLVTKTAGAQTWTYAYDEANQLVQVSAPSGTWNYEYDGLGHRIASVFNGQRTEYQLDPFALGNVVGEFDGTGNLIAHYAHGKGLLARRDAGNGTAFYHFDAQGNTSEITDAAGNSVNQYSYLPFGEPLTVSETVVNPFRYGGELGIQHEGHGLEFMRARYFDPVTGHFTQRDPVGLAGGMNLYAYAGNDPVNATDPSGCMVPGTYENMLLSQMMKMVTPGMKETIRALPKILKHGGELEAIAANMGVNIQAMRLTYQMRFVQGLSNFHLSDAVNILNGSAPIEAAAGAQGAAAVESAVAVNSAVAAEGAAAVEGAVVVNGTTAVVEGTVIEAAPWVLARGALGFGVRAIGVIGTAYTVWQVSDWVGTKIGETKVVSSFVQSWYSDLDYLTDGWLFGVPPSAQLGVPIRHAFDPNDKIGPAGFGIQGFLTGQGSFGYLIDFENVATASAAAQEVLVTDSLSTNLDWSTFELGTIGFNGVTVAVPAGRQSFTTNVFVHTDPNPVRVTAGLNRGTGLVTWDLQSIDPVTGQLVADPLAGFLPPNTTNHVGEGYVTYNVLPRTNLTSGATIINQARIVFDVNPPILTPIVTNTIDSIRPQSTVQSLPVFETNALFAVHWSGNDDPTGSGLRNYTIYVSANNGAYVPWLQTTNTSGVFTGHVGNAYAFYSVASDNAGNEQGIPTTAAAITTVLGAPVITGGLTVSNSLLQINNLAIVVGGDTLGFSVTAQPTNALSYQWDFGDGTSTAWLPAQTTTYVYALTNDCGRHTVTATVRNPTGSVSSNLPLIVACQLTITKLQVGLNFAKLNADSISLAGKLSLPGITNVTQLTGVLAVVNVGGAQVSFALDKKGRGISPNGTCVLTYTKPTTKVPVGSWTATINLSKGPWRTPLAAAGLTNETIKKPGRTVPVPVVVLIGTEAAAAEKPLNYTATLNKTGTAK